MAHTPSLNPLLREIRRAREHGGLTRAGHVVAEGPHLFSEALASGTRIHAVIATGEVEAPPGAKLLRVTPRVFAAISGTEAPQGVLALVEPPAWSPSDLLGARAALVLALDGVQDPGNAGTLLRAAEAFGASGVIFLKGSVSPWNEKALRASAGSAFRLPLLTGLTPAELLAWQKQTGLQLFGTLAERGQAPARVDLRGPALIVIGSEGRGLSDELRACATGVRIPTQGVESLNAAMAGAILLYEAARQRGHA